MEMTEKLIIHKCESLTFRDKKLFLNSRIDKRYFAKGTKKLKKPPDSRSQALKKPRAPDP
jgi:hypothetical protein